MAKGLKFPVKVTPRGGSIVVEGPEVLRQIILLGIKPASSLHPWNQKLTPPEDLIFNIADDMTGGLMISHIYQLFDELERLNMASLSHGPEGVRVLPINANTGEMEIVIQYTDLEEHKSREVRFTAGGK